MLRSRLNCECKDRN